MLSKKEFNQIIKDPATILIIGDIMLDEYHWCDVSRISPEAPVPVCSVTKTTLVPGGAANVAGNLKTLDANPQLIGLIGEDSSGEKLKSKLEENNIPTEHIQIDPSKPTILKSRIVAGQQHVVRVDRENTSTLSRKTQNKILKNIEQDIKNADAILISDYLKGTLSNSLLQKAIDFAKKHKKKVIVDPKGDDYKKYKGATLLTPNFKEFQAVATKTIKTETDVHNEAKKLIKKLDLEALLITRSEKGMSIITKSGNKTDIPTVAKEVYDITGAGDTVIAVLTLALAKKLDLETSARLANIAAGIVVGKIGTSTITPKELANKL